MNHNYFKLQIGLIRPVLYDSVSIKTQHYYRKICLQSQINTRLKIIFRILSPSYKDVHYCSYSSIGRKRRCSQNRYIHWL